MRARIEEWREETHGARFELLRHFLARFFEGEMVGGSGDWSRLAAGAFALLPFTWCMMFLGWGMKYAMLMRRATPAPYLAELHSDVQLLVAIAMCLTAALTAMQWNALFPSRRDLLSLASLPLRPGEVFMAKFGALVAMFGIFATVLTVPTSLVFSIVSSGRWQEAGPLSNLGALVITGVAACSFVFFGAVALQGLMLNLLPGRLFAQVSVLVQAALFTAAFCELPLLARSQPATAWWPPAWFLGLWAAGIGARGGAGRAVLALAVALGVAVLSYLVSYRRYERVLLEGAAHHGTLWWKRAMGKVAAGLLDLWIPDPRQQAMFVFMAKTFARSRNHRLVALAYLGVALGWMAPSIGKGGMRVFSALAIVAPMAISLVVTAALRYLFSLPVELGANWILQITEQDCRDAWLRAVERFVVWCGIVPVYVLAYPIAAQGLGPARALAASLLSFGLVLPVFEVMFYSWRKAPFACSYLPGKRPVVFQTVPSMVALMLLGPATLMVRSASGGWVPFLALLAVEAAVWWCLRTARWRSCRGLPLVYVDELDPAVITLGIDIRVGAAVQPAGGVTADPLFPTGLLQIPRT